MSKVEIPFELRSKLGAEMKMDIHWVRVKLRNGTVHANMIVRGARYITGTSKDRDGVGTVPFVGSEILDIRREGLFAWWPFW
jgi:hypothetical protein